MLFAIDRIISSTLKETCLSLWFCLYRTLIFDSKIKNLFSFLAFPSIPSVINQWKDQETKQISFWGQITNSMKTEPKKQNHVSFEVKKLILSLPLVRRRRIQVRRRVGMKPPWWPDLVLGWYTEDFAGGLSAMPDGSGSAVIVGLRRRATDDPQP
jgi:hypothetical protein